MASNSMPGTFPSTASSSTTAVSFATASSVTFADTTEYPGSGAPQPRQDTQAYLTEQMLSRRSEFIRQQRIKIKVGSWNVAATQGIEKDLSDWVVDKKRDLRTVSVTSGDVREATGETKGKGDDNEDEIGIYAIGLQEVVDITSRDSYFRYLDPKVEMNWKAHAQAALPDGYTCVASTQLMGVLLFVFVSPRLMSLVGSVSTSTVGTGLMGYVGNKGGAGVRLILGDTIRLVFVDVHLAAFANNTDRRNWDAAEIMKRMAFEPVGRSFIGLDNEDAKRSGENTSLQAAAGENLENADVMIWCGDLNYRVDLPNDDIRRLLAPHMPKDLPPTHDTPPNSVSPVPSSPVISPVPDNPEGASSESHPEPVLTLEDTIANLLQYDQLRKQQRESKAFVGFKEGNIGFIPTYKYDVGTVGVWDSSEKARAPSWCDRVLWKVKGADGDRVKGRVRSRTRSSSILTTGEVIFETSDSDEEDLVVSRADSMVPHATSIKVLPISSFKSASGEVKLEQLYYSSYQNVISSDHKPIASLFELSFPAVVPKLRAMVHADVAREVDKIENERRPVVAVIVDQIEGQPYEEGVVDFGKVRLGQRIQRSITVANTGASEAKMKFVGKQSTGDTTPAASSKDEIISREWLKVEFSGDGKDLKDTGGAVVLQPGEACSIIMNLLIEKLEDVRGLNEGSETLMDVLVLRVDNGRDVFLPVGGEWVPSGFGRSLSELVKVPEGAGGIRGWVAKGDTKGEVLYSAPRELYKMTEFLLKNMRELANDEGRWYSEAGWPFVAETWGLDQEKRRMLAVGVWECIDQDLDLDNQDALRIAIELDEDEEWNPTTEEIVEVVAGVLIEWLRGLKEGVVPIEMWPDVLRAAGERKLGEQVLDKLSGTSSSVHANVFVYLTGFLMDTISILSAPPPFPLQRASTGFSLRRTSTNLSLRRTQTGGEEPTSPLSPIASAAAMAFPPRKQPREVLVKRRVLEIFSEAIIRRPIPSEGEKKNNRVEDEEKKKRVAFLEGFVVGV